MLLELKKAILESNTLTEEKKIEYLQVIQEAITTFGSMSILLSTRDIELAMAKVNKGDKKKMEKLINDDSSYSALEETAKKQRRKLNKIAKEVGVADRLGVDSRFSLWTSPYFILGSLGTDAMGTLAYFSTEEADAKKKSTK